MAKKKGGLGTNAFYQDAGKPVSQQDDMPVQQQAGKPEKIKATFYFDPSVIDDLEAAWLRLRKLVSRTVSQEKRNQVSKSLIVELSLKSALKDLEENGTDSRLAKEMARL